MTPQERAVIEAADAWDKRNTTASLARLHAAVQAWRALLASPAGKTVEFGVWSCAYDDSLAFYLAGSDEDRRPIAGWTRLGTARLPITPATVETER